MFPHILVHALVYANAGAQAHILFVHVNRHDMDMTKGMDTKMDTRTEHGHRNRHGSEDFFKMPKCFTFWYSVSPVLA
jgi:hypothetical protein